MKKFLLFISVLFASVVSFAQGEGELVATDITVPVGDTFRMYIKSYSDAAIAKTNEGLKLTVKYQSTDEKVVEPWGNSFKTKKAGTVDMTMLVSTVWEGTQDTFDPENIVMEKTFKVTVVEAEEDPITLPIFDLTWGLPRADAIAAQESWGHALITDHYYSHFPNVVENNPEYIKQLEVFYNNNFEAPITIDQFTENDDLLVASTVICAGWNRAVGTDGYFYNFLKDNGFEFEAPEGMYWNLRLSSNGVVTKASWESVVIDNVWYAGVMMHFDSYEETGIDALTDDIVKFDLQTIGNTIKINAPEFAGKNVTVSDVNGRLIASETVMNGGNEFNVPVRGMYIVKIAGVKSVKVLL